MGPDDDSHQSVGDIVRTCIARGILRTYTCRADTHRFLTPDEYAADVGQEQYALEMGRY
jgi:hypothetical protein